MKFSSAQRCARVALATSRGAIRPSLLLATVALLAGCALLIYFFSKKSEPAVGAQNESPPPAVAESAVAASAPTPRAVPPKRKSLAPPAAAPASQALPPPSASARQILTNLLMLDAKQRTVTPEFIAWWRGQLGELKRSGPEGVAAIREFLAQNQDLMFDEVPEKDKIGYPSLRTALIDALGELGGPAAVETALEVLQTTSLPAEIGQLAQTLEKLAPSQYHKEFLDAAHAVLAQAESGELRGYDVGALFQILAKYGGADAAADLKNGAGAWRFYSAIALGHLPDGSGLPLVIQSAREGDADHSAAAWPVVAEWAGRSDQASGALLDAVRAGSVPAGAWEGIALALSGYEYHISSAPSTMPPDFSYNGSHTWNFHQSQELFIAVMNVAPLSVTEINTRIGLIDQLSGLNPPADAKGFLATGRERLVQELNRRRQ